MCVAGRGGHNAVSESFLEAIGPIEAYCRRNVPAEGRACIEAQRQEREWLEELEIIQWNTMLQ